MIKNFSVSIVIPNFNGEELLKKNLPTLIKASEIRENRIKEIIVVDDKSKDGSIDLLKKDFSEVKLIIHRKNRGFSESVNLGVRSAKGELICLLNTDVSVTSDFLKSVFFFFKDPFTFAVSLHEKGYGGAIGKFDQGFIVHQGKKEVDRPVATFWVNGGSGVFSRSIWFKLGGFDGRLFSPFYWEDLDLSYRALKAGYKIYWDPNSLVFHEHEATIKKIKRTKREGIQQRNQLLFIWKNLTSNQLMRKHILGLFKRLLKHPGYLKVIFLALVKMPMVLKSRRKVKKFFKVSDDAIFANFR